MFKITVQTKHQQASNNNKSIMLCCILNSTLKLQKLILFSSCVAEEFIGVLIFAGHGAGRKRGLPAPTGRWVLCLLLLCGRFRGTFVSCFGFVRSIKRNSLVYNWLLNEAFCPKLAVNKLRYCCRPRLATLPVVGFNCTVSRLVGTYLNSQTSIDKAT